MSLSYLESGLSSLDRRPAVVRGWQGGRAHGSFVVRDMGWNEIRWASAIDKINER